MDYIIYDWIKDKLEIKKLYDVNVFAYLYKYINEHGCYINGTKYLADELNISERSIYDSLKRLVDKQIIKRQIMYKDNLRTHSEYILNKDYINSIIQYADNAFSGIKRDDSINLFDNDVNVKNKDVLDIVNIDKSILSMKLSKKGINNANPLLKYNGYTLGTLTLEYAKKMYTQNSKINAFIELMTVIYDYLDTKTAKYKPRGIKRVAELLTVLKDVDDNIRVKFIMQVIATKQQTITHKSVKPRTMTIDEQEEYNKLYSKYAKIFELK